MLYVGDFRFVGKFAVLAVYFSLALCLLHDSPMVATDAVGHLTEFPMAIVTFNVTRADCLCLFTE